ncbi:Mov34/MPN/PAD-1 family protein [Saccharococcus caldoxylosilyticus]|uniref:JAB domain-containing protein n=1 Tax=Parageobacillus caldoxylosilyticus NBRC 107762 TaxID=1220594 RepID=A0A023DK59_9BACL|nr:Mov34/MPN/PAD-1 family protein [Parageobacillus caldoxylosilyticus]MBB3854518.1 proteasome lid subunit RPN8/RPN11 [Parageobacillus caldoxylosilyticus]GAJ41660.1 hypothetical protein GCA01S_084_00030 [Parageobacillus caldoxylosilyticus NBRC 107762]
MKRKIILNGRVLDKIAELTRKYNEVENGGLIYGRMNPKWVHIFDVSDAGKHAKRSRSGVIFDTEYLIQYTNQKLKEDLFVIGTWHSHPTGYSLYPSSIDKNTMQKINKRFDPLHYPVFMITKWESNKLYFNLYEINEDNRISEILLYEIVE